MKSQLSEKQFDFQETLRNQLQELLVSWPWSWHNVYVPHRRRKQGGEGGGRPPRLLMD